MSVLSYQIETAEKKDLPLLAKLLKGLDLPFEDLGDKVQLFYRKGVRGVLLACGGFEQYGEIGLLRSVAINPKKQGLGIGKEWVAELIEKAEELGMKDLYLLTTTAEGFFKKMGFKNQDRESVPQAIKESEEFSSLCPSTAVLMHKKLS